MLFFVFIFLSFSSFYLQHYIRKGSYIIWRPPDNSFFTYVMLLYFYPLIFIMHECKVGIAWQIRLQMKRKYKQIYMFTIKVLVIFF